MGMGGMILNVCGFKYLEGHSVKALAVHFPPDSLARVSQVQPINLRHALRTDPMQWMQ